MLPSSRRLRCGYRGDEIYNTRRLHICQRFFKTFFNFFLPLPVFPIIYRKIFLKKKRGFQETAFFYAPSFNFILQKYIRSPMFSMCFGRYSMRWIHPGFLFKYHLGKSSSPSSLWRCQASFYLYFITLFTNASISEADKKQASARANTCFLPIDL